MDYRRNTTDKTTAYLEPKKKPQPPNYTKQTDPK